MFRRAIVTAACLASAQIASAAPAPKGPLVRLRASAGDYELWDKGSEMRVGDVVQTDVYAIPLDLQTSAPTGIVQIRLSISCRGNTHQALSVQNHRTNGEDDPIMPLDIPPSATPEGTWQAALTALICRPETSGKSIVFSTLDQALSYVRAQKPLPPSPSLPIFVPPTR